jgi:hypothetical protein
MSGLLVSGTGMPERDIAMAAKTLPARSACLAAIRITIFDESRGAVAAYEPAATAVF